MDSFIPYLSNLEDLIPKKIYSLFSNKNTL